MKKLRGFTLVEVLIVIALLGALAIGFIGTVDPFDQIKKGADSSRMSAANGFYSALINSFASRGKSPITSLISGKALDSEMVAPVVRSLISTGELKTNFASVSSPQLNKLYLTASEDMSLLSVCFQPESKSYRSSPNAVYDMNGNIADCTKQSCFICVGKVGPACKALNSECQVNDSTHPCCAGLTCTPDNQTSGTGKCTEEAVPSVTPVPSISPTPTGDMCSNFDPEYPQFPWTCNYSQKWASYGCDDYCVTDLGCDTFCPPGQRHLRKGYSGGGVNRTDIVGAATCLAHWRETSEDYCISGIDANCSAKPYRSSDSDFNWGCTNPRRPVSWK